VAIVHVNIRYLLERPRQRRRRMRVTVATLHGIAKTRRRTLAGHVLRLSRDQTAYVAMAWASEGDNRKRERPTKTWRKTFAGNLAEIEMTWTEAKESAKGRI